MMMKDGSAHHVHKTGELSGCRLGLASVLIRSSCFINTLPLIYGHYSAEETLLPLIFYAQFSNITVLCVPRCFHCVSLLLLPSRSLSIKCFLVKFNMLTFN